MAEKKPIIKVYLARSGEAWFSLPKEKRNEILGKVTKNLEELGARTIVSCTSYWSNEEWSDFGVEEFPDIEAVQKHAEFLLELGWPKYGETRTYLGTR